MTQSVSNLRVRRTQKLLREAFIDLIEERSFEALTIGELTERAMVSRAAFYRNYQDKYSLVEQLFEEAMNALLSAGGELGQEHPAEVWVAFFEHIAQYDRLYRALLGSKGSPWFVRKMRDALVPDLVSTLFVEAITWWLEQGRPYLPREIATRTALLAAALFKEAGTWH